MFNKILKRTKKTILLSTASVFTLLAAFNVYQSNSNEVAYMLQGASKATMVELVEQVGGEVIHDFSVISAISVSLTEEQAIQLNTINPLVRLSTKSQTIETASFLWPRRTTVETASFLWPRRTTVETASFLWPRRTTVETASFLWPRRTTVTYS